MDRRGRSGLVIAGTDVANTPGYLEAVRARHADLPGPVFTGDVAEEDVEVAFRSATVVAFPYTATTGSSGPLHLPAIGDFLEVIRDGGFTGETLTPRTT